MILVAAATAQEVRGFRHPSAQVRVTGMGREATRRALLQALAEMRFDRVISTGFAGGLDPSLETGRIVVDTGRSDPDWTSRFLKAFPRAAQTPFASAHRPVATPEEKAALFAATGCGAVDMESDAISELIAESGRRALFVRVVLDDHATPIRAPVMDWCRSNGTVRTWSALRWALAGRGRVGELLRLTRLAARCAPILRRALAVAVDEAGPSAESDPGTDVPDKV